MRRLLVSQFIAGFLFIASGVMAQEEKKLTLPEVVKWWECESCKFQWKSSINQCPKCKTPTGKACKEWECKSCKFQWRSSINQCPKCKTPTGKHLLSIRQVNWRNRKYLPKMIELEEGVGELHEYEELGAPHDTHIFSFQKVCYGDINRDKSEEAVIAINEDAYTPQRSWNAGWLFAYNLQEGNIVELDITLLPHSKILDVTVERTTIFVRTLCGNQTQVESFIYRDGKLQAIVGEEIK